jgi:hypothetical protein
MSITATSQSIDSMLPPGNPQLLVDVNLESTMCRRDFVWSRNVTSWGHDRKEFLFYTYLRRTPWNLSGGLGGETFRRSIPRRWIEHPLMGQWKLANLHLLIDVGSGRTFRVPTITIPGSTHYGHCRRTPAHGDDENPRICIYFWGPAAIRLHRYFVKGVVFVLIFFLWLVGLSIRIKHFVS